MSFVQPIISITDDYIVIKVPRETVIKTTVAKEKVKLTAENLRGILKNSSFSGQNSVVAAHAITKLWKETALKHYRDF